MLQGVNLTLFEVGKPLAAVLGLEYSEVGTHGRGHGTEQTSGPTIRTQKGLVGLNAAVLVDRNFVQQQRKTSEQAWHVATKFRGCTNCRTLHP